MSNPAECSPDTPWGIHREVVDNGCPRCGWRADGREQVGEPSAELRDEVLLAA